MRLLQIDDQTLKDIEKVINYANEHKFDKYQMRCLNIWMEEETESVNILQRVGEKSTSMEQTMNPGIEIKSYGSSNEMMDDWVKRGLLPRR